MDCDVTYAYHVTNFLVEDDSPPDWRCLKTSTAPDQDFDGPLFELGVNGVFLTTTLMSDYKLPTRSIYPIGGTSGECYWRVRVPLTRFNNKRIFKVQENDNNATSQVLLLLADNSYSNLIYNILGYPDVEELTEDDENYFLYRDEVTKDWYSNNFDPQDPYWVNVFVPHRVKLGYDCEWDIVQHY